MQTAVAMKADEFGIQIGKAVGALFATVAMAAEEVGAQTWVLDTVFGLAVFAAAAVAVGDYVGTEFDPCCPMVAL